MAAPGAFMGARPPMDRAHEGDPTRPPAESFGLTPGVPPRRNRTAPWLILIATYLKKHSQNPTSVNTP